MTVVLPPPSNSTKRVHAGFIVLVRNSELYGMLSSMRDLEDRFNHKFGYPWIFLNDEPFTEEFKSHTTAITHGKTYYGLVDKSKEEHGSATIWG
ncbi:alpha 1,2-mannosyltransferase 2.4.1 [Apophysomyces sp. BC1015]|nr:alpha 1,2-mannosyltransferase 2.4.1 [Apophysomyces sp. BC1015]